jgi:cytochrome c553
MPRHIFRLVLLLVAFAAMGYAAIVFLTVDSFFQYGHYRGDSVAEVASDKPKYQGTVYCQSCHEEQFAAWSGSVHNNRDAGKIVICETCHGAAGERDDKGGLTHVSTGPVHPDNVKLTVPAETRALCTLCHEKMAGRPAQQPQIVVAEHAGEQQCGLCHDPHSPLLNLVSSEPAAAGDAAAGEAKAADCAGCHGEDGVSADLPGPTLAGQKAAYLVESFMAYASGARSDDMMSAAAEGVSDEDAADLAAYYASLTCESTLSADKQAASPGRAAAAACIACHGADGVSTNPAWPNLVGFAKEHLVAALNAYRSGARTDAVMGGAAKDLSDADIESAADYYAGASCK